MAQITNNQIPWPVIIDDAPLSASQAAFEISSSTAMVPYRVPRSSLRQAPVFFTGYAYVWKPPGGAPGTAKLKRVLPQPHPDWDWLWAHRVETQAETSPDEGATSYRGQGLGTAGPVDVYRDYRVSVFYSHRPYRVLSDELLAIEGGQEHRRFVEKLPGKPYTEFVQIQGTALKFVNPPQTEFPGGATFRISKIDVKWVWHEVPVAWVCGPKAAKEHIPLVPNITLLAGQVNADTFDNYPGETLYLDSVDVEEDWAPCDAQTLGLPVTIPPRYFRITFNFKYFGLGWNTLPRPGTNTWARVQFPNGDPLYQLGDFNQLFAGVDPFEG